MNLPSEWMPCLQLMGFLAIEVTVIVALAAVLQTRSRRALWHHAAWQMAAAGLFALLVLELTGLSRGLIAWNWSLTGRITPIQPAEKALVLPLLADRSGESASLTPEFHRRVARQLAVNRQTSPGAEEGRPAQKLRHPDSLTLRAGFQQPEPFFQGRSTPWPAVVWVIGTGAALGPVCIGWLFFGLCYRKRRQLRDGILVQRVEILARRLGIGRRVRIFVSSRLRGPVAFGLMRPTIGLPVDFTKQFTDSQQDAMLTHELAHLAANDPAWQRLADVVASILWWHPLVWWMRHRLRKTAEHAADEASLVVKDGPGLLAECLVKLASRAAAPAPVGLGPGDRPRLPLRARPKDS